MRMGHLLHHTVMTNTNMVNIPEVWSTYHNYGQYTSSMVKIPDIWSKFKKYGQHTRSMVNIFLYLSPRAKWCSIVKK